MTDGALAHWLTPAEARRLSGPVALSWNADEAAALARRFGWLAAESVSAQLALTAASGDWGEGFAITGTVKGTVTQACVATAQPVSETIDLPVSLRLVTTRPATGADEEEMELDDGALDTIMATDGRFDLADIAAETLALGVSPWPRHADADAFLRERGVLSEEEAGAFGALAGLKARLEGKG